MEKTSKSNFPVPAALAWVSRSARAIIGHAGASGGTGDADQGTSTPLAPMGGHMETGAFPVVACTHSDCGKWGMPPVFRSLLMLFAGIWLATAAQAATYPINQCAGDRFGSDLGCTANDVSITGMAVVGDTTSCVGGSNVTLDLQLTVNFQNPSRYDIGIFISNDGKNPEITAANGGATSCSVSVLPNSSPFLNLDGPTDTCGDGENSLSGIHYMSDVTVPCQSLPGASGNLYIPFVVSWDVNKTPPGAVCTSNANPVPGAQSKCNAPTIVQGSVAVVVLPSITKDDGKTTLFSGDSTSYSVTISNTTGATLFNAVFKDPFVAGITATGVSCTATGLAICPLFGSTVAGMQGAGLTIPLMPNGSSVTFTVDATLTGSPGDTRTNTATVTVGSQTNTAADTNTIVDSIAILPTTQSLNGDKGSTATYTYTLYNFGPTADTVTLAAVSSLGWTVGLSPTSISVAAGGSTTVTLAVTIPSGAAIGDVDTTTISATSGNNPGKTATATAVTTVTSVLTLTPSNTGAGGAGASVYYTHRVQNNASSSKTVSLTPVFSGCTGTWTSALYQTDKSTALTSPVTLAASGGYLDFVLKVSVPTGAAASSTCTATLTAQYTSGAPNAVSVTDVTTVKNMVLYEDTGYTTEQTTFPVGNTVYAKGFGLTSGTSYEYRWYNSSGTEVCTPRQTSTTGTSFPDTCTIPAAGPLGTWVVQIWNKTSNTLFVQTNFYVGPDHLAASYGGATPATNTDTVIDLALHDRFNHVVPFDAAGNLVKGSPTDTEGPLMITVTVSGSASIVSTTLSNAVITGQSVTGKLDSTLGTATLTIRDSVAETVTVTPVSYKGLLYGSPLRDESATIAFVAGGPHHLEIQHASGTGLTCAASTLTIKACADAACATAYVGGVSGTLSATGTPTVTWDGTTGGAAGAGFAIASGSSTVNKNVQVATAGSVVFGISSATPVPSSATTCNFGAPACTFTADLAGFIFSDTANGSGYTIPAQVSGIATPAFYLRAVQASTVNPAVCTPAIISSTISVEMGYTCSNPPACQPGSLMTINATSIAPTGTPVSLTFDANGSSPVSARYDDVGQVALSANATVTPFSGAAAVTLNGSSNAFVVAPHHFGFSGVTAAPIKAGADFSATVTAYNGLATPTATANFGQELVAEGVTLSFSKCLPTGANAVNGIFSGNVGTFTGGAAGAGNLNWSEVGNGDLVATLASGSYLGSGLTASGNTGTGGTACNGAGNVGRFMPDHFDTVVTGPMTCPVGLTCPGGGLAYSGQPFTANVYARNAAGVITQNYDGTANTSPNFAASVTLTAWDAPGSTTTQNPPAATPGALTGNAIAATSFSKGATVSPGTPPTPIYTFGTTPTDPTDIYVRAVDADGVTSLRVPAGASVEGGIKVVNGRIKVSNAYGSELLPLTLTATAQYFTAAGWRNSITDNVTNLVLLANYPVGAGTTAVTLTPSSGDLLNGVLSIRLGKPSAGAGIATIDPTAPGYLPLITGTATFGVYKGNNSFIYRRESY
jgi:hypothetical protein